MSWVRRIKTKSPGQTKKAAAAIIRELLSLGRRPLVLALSGELGSGKTTFIQGLASSLGIRAKVQSPTFVLTKWYRLGRRAKPFRHFVHVDAYRLETPAEARRLGLKDMCKDREAIVVIEWAERIRSLIPRDALRLRFTHGERRNERTIQISNFQ